MSTCSILNKVDKNCKEIKKCGFEAIKLSENVSNIGGVPSRVNLSKEDLNSKTFILKKFVKLVPGEEGRASC